MAKAKKKKKTAPRRGRALKIRDRRGQLKRFVENNDPFVDYVLEDLWIRAKWGEGAIRCRIDGDDTLEIIAMNDQALEDVYRLIASGKFALRKTKLRRPSPEDYEQFLDSQSEIPQLPGMQMLGYDDEYDDDEYDD